MIHYRQRSKLPDVRTDAADERRLQIHLRVLCVAQLITLCFIIAYMQYFLVSIHELELEVQKYTKSYHAISDHAQKRVKRTPELSSGLGSPLQSLESTSSYIWIAGQTRMRKTTVDGYCNDIQDQCSSKSQTLQGASGATGNRGPRGFTGSKGAAGQPGPSGDPGLVGQRGPKGKDGRDGKCRCMYKKTTRSPYWKKPTPRLAVTPPPILSTASPSDRSTTAYTGPPTLAPNVRKCYLKSIGKATQHAMSQFKKVGAWMRDSQPVSKYWESRYWVTSGYAGASIHQYRSEERLKRKIEETPYFIDHRSSGTGFIVRKNMLYYHQAGSPTIVRYNLENPKRGARRDIPRFASQDCPQTKGIIGFEECDEEGRDAYLYNLPHNFADFSADENGIWLIFHYKNDDHLSVAKLDEKTLNTTVTWRIPGALINETGNAFVMCGVLYTVENSTAKKSRINYAFDLFKNREHRINIPWTNPNGTTTMIDYNPIDRRIYFFNNKRLLSSPVGISPEIEDNWDASGAT